MILKYFVIGQIILNVQDVECNPACDENDDLCHAGGQYVDCKLCGQEGGERCHFSPWCWVQTRTDITPEEENEEKIISKLNNVLYFENKYHKFVNLAFIICSRG